MTGMRWLGWGVVAVVVGWLVWAERWVRAVEAADLVGS